ncbi:MAG: hypothetical protein AAF125_21770, partial [Chloroflexota bacterium]
QALSNVNVDSTVFVHIIDEETDIIVAQRDQMPRANTYPTTLWMPGEYVTDSYVFEGVQTAAEVRIGLYDSATGERLAGVNDDTFVVIE